MTLIKQPLHRLEDHLKCIEKRNDVNLFRSVIQNIKDLEYEIEYMKSSKDNWQPIETRPEAEAEPFLVMTFNDDRADCFDYVVVQVSNFEGQMYADGRQAIIDYDDRITNAVAWMYRPRFDKIKFEFNEAMKSPDVKKVSENV